MNDSLDKPGLYVVESKLLSSAHRSPLAYRKIGAVVVPSGRATYVARRVNEGYVPADLTRLDGDFGENILEGVASFIGRYMSRDSNGSYNCHTLANWLTNGPSSPATTNPDIDQLDTTYPDGNLRHGQRGYVFARGGDHSTFGLGGDLTLQVMTNYGNMGVLSHDEIAWVYGDVPRVAQR